MMKNFSVCLFAMFEIALLNVCGTCTSKKYACDAQLYMDAQNWLKIDSGKKFIYKYNTHYDTFSINSYSNTVSEYARSVGFKTQMLPCKNTMFAKSKEVDTTGKANLNLNLSMETYYPGKNKIYNATIDIRGSRFELSYFSADDFEANNAFKTTLRNTTLINGNTYRLINLLEKESLQVKYNQPYKLFLAHNFGLVAFETSPLHQV